MFNILRDITFSLIAGGLDDGTFNAGVTGTILVDTFQFSMEHMTDDHSNGQELVSKNRITKKDFSFNFETKLKHASLRKDINAGATTGTHLTLYAGGSDDLIYGTGSSLSLEGNPATAATASAAIASLCMDSITISQNNTLEDHSCATDEMTKHRIKKRAWEYTFETKMQEGGTAGIEYLLKNNELVGFYVPIMPGTLSTAQVLLGGHGVVTGYEFGYDGPNTLRFTLAPYGKGIGVTLGTGDTATVEGLLLPSTGSAAHGGDATGFGATNELFQFIALNGTGGTGALDITAIGIVEGISINIKQGPITISGSFKSYGTTPTFTVS